MAENKNINAQLTIKANSTNSISFADDGAFTVLNADAVLRVNQRIEVWGGGSGKQYLDVRDQSGNVKIMLNAEDNSYFAVNNVGIGTTSPGAKLHVSGTGNQGTQAWFGNGFIDNASYHYDFARVGFSVEDSDGADTGAGFMFNTRNSTDTNWMHGYIYQPQDGGIAFGTGGAGTVQATEKVRITSGGNVGIGKTDPSAPLHINGGSTNQVVKIQSNSAPYIRFKEGGTDVGFIQFGTDTYISNQKDGTLNFRTNNTDKMTILSNGNVGIGTTNPAGKLHVYGGRSYFAPTDDGGSGVDSQVIDIYNPHDTAFTADALTAYNAHTSWDIGSKSTYTISSRPKSGSIYTFAGENASAPVAINRYVQFDSSNDNPLLNWTFYQYDGSGTAATDLKVPNKVWTIQSYQNSGSDTLLILSGDGSLQLSQYGEGYLKSDSSGNVTVDNSTFLTSYTETQTLDDVTDLGNTTTNSITTGSITATSSAYVRMRVDQTDSAMIDVGVSSGGSEGFLNVQNTGDNHSTDDPQFKFLLNGTEAARFDGAGNLGIGTDQPSRRLHVNAGTTNHVAIFESTDATAWIQIKDDATASYISTTENGLDIAADSNNEGASSKIRFYIDGSNKASINSGGTVISTNGFSSDDGVGKFYTWRAVNNTGNSSNVYVKIARITALQSNRFAIELAGRRTSYSDNSLPAYGKIVGQLNNDNNYDIVFYDFENTDVSVVEDVGQVDVSTTETDIYIKVDNYSEISATAHISAGSIQVASTASTTEPTGYVSANARYYMLNTSSGDDRYVNVTGDTMSGDLEVNKTDPAIVLKDGTQDVAWLGDFGGGTDGQLVLFNNSGTSTVAINGEANSYLNGGNVGIGETNPTEKLHVVGNIISKSSGDTSYIAHSGSTDVYLAIAGRVSDYPNPSDNAGSIILTKGTTGESYPFNSYGHMVISARHNAATDILFRTNGALRAVIDGSGNVGIGTTDPRAKLEVFGENFAVTNSGRSVGGIHIASDSNDGAGTYSGGISFAGPGSGSAGISGVQGTSDGDTQGLAFFTHQSGTGANDSVEKMRITHEGGVGIGTTDPSEILHIKAGRSDVLLESTTAGQATRYRLKTTSREWRIGTNGPKDDAFWIYDGDATSYRLEISTAGQLKLPAYGAGSFKGDPEYMLGVDSSGNVVEKAATYFGTNTSNGTYTNQWQKVLQIDTGNFDSQAFRLRIEGSGNTSAQSIVAEIEFNYKNQNGAIRARTTVNSYGTTPVDKDDVAVYFDTTNLKATFYFKVTENYTRPIYSIVSGYFRNYTFFSNVIGDDAALALETNDSITSNLKFQGITQDNDSGYVGIGTSAPSTSLDLLSSVNGINAIIENDTHNAILQILASANAKNSEIWFGDAGDNDIGKIDYDHANNSMAIVTNNSRAITIDSAGDVGIGETSPTFRLEVKDPTSGIATIQVRNDEGTDGSGAGIRLYTSTDTYGNKPVYIKNIPDATGGALVINSRAADNSYSDTFYISGYGNVGIGTTNPGAKLDVIGNGRFYSAIGVNDNVRTGIAHYDTTAQAANVGGQLVLGYKYHDNGSYTEGAILKMYKLNSTSGDYSSGLKFQVRNTGDNLSTKMTLDPSGNLGIGSTSPAAKLNVASTGANAYSSTITKGTNMKGIINALSNNADDMVGIYFGTGTTSEGTHWSGITGSRSQSATDWSTQLNFYTHDENLSNINDATQKMVIKGNGNVGIGTASPEGLLHIYQPSGAGPFLITRASDKTDVNFQVSVDSTKVRLNGYGVALTFFTAAAGSGTNASERMRITSAGNVGIGTTSPGYKLDVSGSSRIDGLTSNLALFVTTNSSFGAGISFEDSTNPGNDAVHCGGIGSDFYISVGYSERMRVNSSGNVGIGTTSPSHKLDVNGDIAVKGASIINRASAALVIGDIAGTDSVTNLTLTTSDRNTEVFLDDSGNVGINDTTPSYALDVTGTIRATGDVIAYSDARVKENVETIPNALDKVKAMRGVGYNKIGSEERSIGVIAQEMLDVMPEVVHTDDQGMHSVAYGNLVGVLIEAMKEQQAQIDELKEIIANR